MLFYQSKNHKWFFALLFIMASASAQAQTKVGGGIFSNTTWKKNNSPYVVTSNIIVFDNVTLTIEPGVVVKFDQNISMNFLNSQLIAKGTINDSIFFTANSDHPDSLFWPGLIFQTANSPTYKGEQIQLEYVSGSYASILFDFSNIFYSSAKISHSSFKHNQYAFKGGLESFYLVNCEFSYNSIALYVGIMDTKKCNFIYNSNAIISGGTSGSVPTVDSCLFVGNTQMGVQGEGNYTNSTFTNNTIAANIVPGSNFGSFINNIVKNNQIGVQVYGSSGDDTFYDNTICGNYQANIQRLGLGFASYLKNNCFCTTDSIAIEEKIWDAKDDLSIGLVIISSDYCASTKNKCSISGRVHEGNSTVNSGSISAINLTTLQDYTAIVEADGSFHLNYLPKGNYVLKATPESVNYVTTFYPNKINQEEAKVLNLQGDIIDIDIFLQLITGMDDPMVVGSFNALPNPFNSQLVIINSAEITVKNVTGDLVFKGSTNGSSLNTSSWNVGVYFLTGADGKTIKVLKQ